MAATDLPVTGHRSWESPATIRYCSYRRITMPAIPELVQDYGLQSRPDKVQLRGIADNVPVHRLF